MPRKEGGSRLSITEDCEDATIWEHEEYTKKSIERLKDTKYNCKIQKKWEEKQQYGYFKQQVRGI